MWIARPIFLSRPLFARITRGVLDTVFSLKQVPLSPVF